MSGVSVIVPTRNRGGPLSAALRSLGASVDGAKDVEIIVVDNGSTDATRESFKAVAEAFPRLTWRYVYDAMPGLLTGRHRGVAEASGDILSFLDDDVVVSPTWLRSVREAFGDPDVGLVGGPSWPRYEIEPPAWLSGFWDERDGQRRCGALSLIDAGPRAKPIEPYDVWGLNFSIRRSVFDPCGGFHPDNLPKSLQRYQGDGETGLAIKARARGYRALHHPGAALWHVIPASRLTPDAMEQRGFYQGVADSFAEIRRDGAVRPSSRAAWPDLRDAKRALRRAYLRRRGDAPSVRRLMEAARMDGFHFHQTEVSQDPALLAWVLKPDFIDYQLPAGWREYAQGFEA